MRKLCLFAGLWLFVGFTTGTAVLQGPLRWIASQVREHGWSERAEQAAILPLIVSFVLGSALVALWLTATVRRSPHRHVRLGAPALCAAAALATLWLWLNPRLMASDAADEHAGASFTFGPYPTEERLRELEREGYTAVVSLLHPLVVPFEPKLIADGRAAAGRAGIGYINVPMLPWVSDNATALAQIEQLAQDAAGKHYYVHCYLGKDRVRVVKRLVEQIDSTARIAVHAGFGAQEVSKRLAHALRLERGEVVQVDDGVWLTPYPVNDEFMSYILTGTHGYVVSLLDPQDVANRFWIDQERELLAGNRIRWESRPLPLAPFDPARALEIARETAEMPRPLVVHAFLGLDSGRSPAAEAFLQAFRSDLPPLPPALFVEPLAAGPARVIAPNVAVGPRPTPAEFADALSARGVRGVVYVGAADPILEQDRAAAAAAGLSWREASERDPALREALSNGGPWYVYGPGSAQAEPDLAAALGPALPPAMRANRASAPPAAEPAAAVPAPAPPPAGGFLESLLPSPRRAILLAPSLLLLVVLAASFAGWLRVARGVKAPYTRKVFHFVIFTSAGALHFAAGLSAVTLYGTIVSCAVTYAVLRGDGFAFYEALARPSDAPRRTLFVIVPLVTTAIGGLAANLLFGSAAQIGYLVAGWGDAVAEPVGTRWGRHRYRVPSLAGIPATRSLEGSAAVLLCGGAAALLGLHFGGVPARDALAIAAACGVAGAAVEAFSNHGLDNLTVQLAAAGTASLLLGS